MRRIEFEQKLFSKELGSEIKGFVSPKVKKILRDNSSYKYIENGIENKYTILSGMEYRPDKVAEYYLGNSKLSWMIDFANNFTNGIKDYRLGRVIRIPNLDIVNSILKDYVEY